METVLVTVIAAVIYLIVVATMIGVFERRKAQQRAEELYMRQVEQAKQKIIKEMMTDCLLLREIKNVNEYDRIYGKDEE